MRFTEKTLDCAIAAIHNEVNQILIVKRGPTAPWEANKWSLVGGCVEDGEEIVEALRREVKEETQMVITDIKPFDTIKCNWGNLHVFTAQSRDKPILDYENVEYAWVTNKDLESYNFVPNVKETLSQLL